MGYNINEVYHSNSEHLRSEDLGQDMPTYTIAGVSQKVFDNGDVKLIVAFNETDKSLVLNATNARAIGELYSPDTDTWIGKQIMLFTMPVDFQGKQVKGLRVRAPQGNIAHPAHTDTVPLNDGREQAPPPSSENDYGKATGR